MPRPPLQLETWGNINRTIVDGKPAANARFRDSDGVTRRMQRVGRTAAEAERNLIAAMKDRLAPAGEDLSRDSRIGDLAEVWFAEIEASDLAQGTKTAYRRCLDSIVIKGVGSLRLIEATVPRVDRFIKGVTDRNGLAQAKRARVVLAGMFALAIRHGAMTINPATNSAPVRSKRAAVIAPSIEDVRGIQQLMRDFDAGTDKQGRKRWTDLADLCDLYIATAARTAEVLALEWPAVHFDLAPPTVDIVATVIEDDAGKLAIQPHPKSDMSTRGLKLPAFAVEMLMRRRVDSINSLVFPSAAGTPRWPNNMRRQWRQALQGSTYEGITPRSFRKAVATLLKREMGAEAVKEQLGHASEDVARKHYIQATHQGPDATLVLEESFGKAASKRRVGQVESSQ